MGTWVVTHLPKDIFSLNGELVEAQDPQNHRVDTVMYHDMILPWDDFVPMFANLCHVDPFNFF